MTPMTQDEKNAIGLATIEQREKTARLNYENYRAQHDIATRRMLDARDAWAIRRATLEEARWHIAAGTFHANVEPVDKLTASSNTPNPHTTTG